MIYTFYSYKGGVGRTMALANVAELLYQAGLRVLMVDWDLEAPGLERFFPFIDRDSLNDPGVIDLLTEYKQRMTQRWSTSDGDSSLPFQTPDRVMVDIYPRKGGQGKLWLLPAGRRSTDHYSDYVNQVLTFNWQDFYQKWEGARYFEWLRSQFEQIADVTLIDSRTGLSEIGGVCTYQLADVVVMLCAANQQNLEGICRMLVDLKRPEVAESRGRPLEVLVIPARIEYTETDRLDDFKTEFLKQLGEHAPRSVGMEVSNLWQLALPYIPRYAYREEVAVREKEAAGAEGMIEAFSKLAFAMSRFAPSSSPIRLALTETTIRIGDKVVVGSVVGNSIVLTGGGDITAGVATTVYTERVSAFDPVEALDRYRRMLVANSRYLPLRGADVGADDPSIGQRPLSLAHIYVDLDTRTSVSLDGTDKRRRKDAPLVPDDGKTRALPALEAVISNSRLVLLGDPGSGKSTFVNHLAHCLAAHALEPEAGWLEQLPGWPQPDAVPLLVVLRDFARWLASKGKAEAQAKAEPSLVWEFIARPAEGAKPGVCRRAAAAVSGGRTSAVLFDGLDEIAGHAAPRACARCRGCFRRPLRPQPLPGHLPDPLLPGSRLAVARLSSPRAGAVQ